MQSNKYWMKQLMEKINIKIQPKGITKLDMDRWTNVSSSAASQDLLR